MNILVIEDETRIAELIARGLRETGHQVLLAHNGQEGAERLLKERFDVALLDIYLPGMDGFRVLETVRARQCKIPILVLTAVDAVQKIVQAFDLGADDYLVKPFLLEILVARISALARRSQPKSEPPILHSGGITLDRSRRIAIVDGRHVYLPRKQFQLLEVLIRRVGLVTSREELIEAGWGNMAEVKVNTLDVYIHGLRAKLDTQSGESHTMIRTVHGVGYMFVGQKQ